MIVYVLFMFWPDLLFGLLLLFFHVLSTILFCHFVLMSLVVASCHLCFVVVDCSWGLGREWPWLAMSFASKCPLLRSGYWVGFVGAGSFIGCCEWSFPWPFITWQWVMPASINSVQYLGQIDRLHGWDEEVRSLGSRILLVCFHA